MSDYQQYVSKIFINADQAHDQIDALRKKIKGYQQDKENALRTGGKDGDKAWKKAEKDIKAAETQIKRLSTTSEQINHVLANLSTAKPKELQQTMKAINKELTNGSVQRGSEMWKAMQEQLKRVKTELKGIQAESAAATKIDDRNLFSKGFDFLNKNFGAFTQLWGALTGLNDTVRQTTQAVEYECLDEFTTDYDEDGLEYTGASNLEYNLSDSEENKYADMPEDILAMFTVKEYETQTAANTAAKTMTEQERMTTLFRLTADPYGERWAYCTTRTDDDGNTTYSVQPCLWYLHMRRQTGDDASTVQLNMVPCADQYVEFDIKRTAYIGNLVATKTYKVAFSMPSSTNDDEQSIGTYQEYVSVQDYFENGDEPSEQDEAERMELYFLKDTTYSFDTGFSSTPLTFKAAGSWYAKGSLRFEGGSGAANIGQFHQQAKTIENREQIVIKFLADTLPDPKQIFLFRNKRFLCDKVEMQITDTGIDRLMTGYFYEIN